jgi:type VI protein secretion system component Hcp
MTEIFAKIEGLTGTGTGAHQGWLKVSSAQLSSTDKNSVVISRVYDRLSSNLFKLFKDGIAIPAVTIDFVKGGRLETRLELTSVVIAEFYPVSGQPPMESITFHYTAVKFVQGTAASNNAAVGPAWAERRNG